MLDTTVFDPLKPYGDATSLMLILGTFAAWLPPVASVLSIIWVLIRIYETDTIQNFLYHKEKDDGSTD